MLTVTGTVQSGLAHFTRRIGDHAAVFAKATGETLHPGTLNVKCDRKIPVREHFRIVGSLIGEPEQDLLFEVCRLNGVWAYRIRPLNLIDGSGGHGDNVLEIASATHFKSAGIKDGDKVTIELFR